MRFFVRLVVVFCLAIPPLVAAEEFDDCDANFIAFIGSDAYRFSPAHEGELGSVRLFGLLSYQRAAHGGREGVVPWRLTIERVDDAAVVLTIRGRGTIGSAGTTLAEYWWDGRDERGEMVPSGRYRYTFNARYVDRSFAPRVREIDYEMAVVDPRDEATAGSDEVYVDHELSPADATRLRVSANVATSCQIQQNVPLEAGFGYNFYYGSTHAHSNWSDGGQPTTACSSGNAYGSGTMTPADVFAYARDTAGLDFWVVNEHNHLIQDAIANNNGPVTEAKVLQRYQDGLAAANAATTSSFVGMYGVEWGVSSNPDQGHVTLIETPKLFGWETCSNCNGPSPECTPGTDCYFDVFTPKRYGYLTLYARSVENPSSAGALGIFNHPGSSNFDGFALDANADNAIQGIAVRSGLAFSTATDCSSSNVGATDYSVRWREALAKGFHLAPAADHDSHCNNYGVALPTRTVYLVPNATSPVLTKANLLAAQKARRFYATEDPNLQLVFKTSDGARVMGEIFDAPGGATIVGNVYDPDGEGVTTIEIWRGQIGAAAPTAAYSSASGVSSISLTESLTSGSYWYYVHVIQADGHDAWSAPMWITYQSGTGGGGDTTAPGTSITAPADGATVSGSTLVTASASDDTGVTKVEFYLDGSLAASDTTAPYEWSWDTTTAADATHTLQSKAYDAAANVGSSATVSVTVSNGGTTPPPSSSVDVSGWRLVQANAAYEFVLPTGTSIPADGYLVVGRSADKASFETFWKTTLPTNVVYVNSGGSMPVINGDETFELRNGSGTNVDGPTIAMSATAAKSVQRTDPCSAAGSASSWNILADTSGTPGSGAGAGCGGGVKINEFSDATGTGNYVYEFIELHYDAAASSDTEAPVTSITSPAAGTTVSGVVVVQASATDDVGVSKVEFHLDGALQATDTSAPYEWSWDTKSAANGSHTLSSKAFDAAGNIGTSSGVGVTVSNDTTAPVTSISSPAAGATISGTTPVTASASDAVGVTKVEFYLDGVLKATDSTSPYEWSWDTTTVANASYGLSSKAYDAAGNVGTSATVSVTVSNVTGIDLSSWKVTQANASLTYFLPAGTTIPSAGYVVIARNADKASFETFWGRTLASNVVFINAGDAMPQINGSESYTLYNAAGTKVDGATVAMASSGGQSLQRVNGCGNANKASSWNRVASSSATPGSGAPAACGKGAYISEFSDALGTGNYIYEFIELYNDK